MSFEKIITLFGGAIIWYLSDDSPPLFDAPEGSLCSHALRRGEFYLRSNGVWVPWASSIILIGFGFQIFPDVPTAEAFDPTGLPDQARAIVQEIHREYELNLLALDDAGGPLTVDHTSYDVLSTATAPAVWVARD